MKQERQQTSNIDKLNLALHSADGNRRATMNKNSTRLEALQTLHFRYPSLRLEALKRSHAVTTLSELTSGRPPGSPRTGRAKKTVSPILYRFLMLQSGLSLYLASSA